MPPKPGMRPRENLKRTQVKSTQLRRVTQQDYWETYFPKSFWITTNVLPPLFAEDTFFQRVLIGLPVFLHLYIHLCDANKRCLLSPASKPSPQGLACRKSSHARNHSTNTFQGQPAKVTLPKQTSPQISNNLTIKFKAATFLENLKLGEYVKLLSPDSLLGLLELGQTPPRTSEIE